MTGARHRLRRPIGADLISAALAPPIRPGRERLCSLSVIIPCRNGGSLLGRQLAAVAAQEYDGWFEVIVADNGSTDDSAETASAWRTRVARLEVVSAGRRRGAAWARNEASATARGEALVFVDHDDEMAPGYLMAMVTALAEHDIVAARVDHTALNADFPRAKWHWQSDGLMDGLGFLPCAGAGTIGVRHQVFDYLGGFDATLKCGEDLDFCWRAQLAGFDLGFAPEAILRYAYRVGLIDHLWQELQWGRNDAFLYRRYRGRGMPRHSLGAVLRDWVRVLDRAGGVRSRADLSACAGMLGRRLGRISGSIENRTLYL